MARRTKHQGYHDEHAFALDWNAMLGYHLLMRLAQVFNTLSRLTRQLRALYQEHGVRGAIAFIRSSCAASWLDPAQMRVLLAQPFLLQLE